MTDLKTRITEDVKLAMKAGDKARLGVLRMLTAELKDREVVRSQTITDAVVIEAIEKMIKQRRDSESQFRAGNRLDLAEIEAAEIVVLTGYLPQALTETELASLIGEGIAATGAAGIKDMGKVVAWLKPHVAGRADMGKLSGLVKARLG
jgi:uncharacterized protein YqeY